MISDSRPSQQSATAASPVEAGQAPVPIWLIILLFLLLYWGMVYVDLRGGGFDMHVYEPYRSVEEVANYVPVDPMNSKRLPQGSLA